MKRILLVCGAGMSTSILVKKMQDVAAEKNIECEIEAHGNVDIGQFVGKFDVCLVAPQIRFSLEEIQKALPSIPVEVIDMLIYGTANGEKALEQAIDLIDNK